MLMDRQGQRCSPTKYKKGRPFKEIDTNTKCGNRYLIRNSIILQIKGQASDNAKTNANETVCRTETFE